MALAHERGEKAMIWDGSVLYLPWPRLLSAMRLWANHLVSPFLHLLMDFLLYLLSSSETTRGPRLFFRVSVLHNIEGEGWDLSLPKFNSEIFFTWYYCTWVLWRMPHLSHLRPWELWPHSSARWSLCRWYPFLSSLWWWNGLLGFLRNFLRVFSQHLKHFCHLDMDMECTGSAHLPHWSSAPFPAPPLCLPFRHCLHQHNVCRTQVWLQHRIASSCIFINSLAL